MAREDGPCTKTPRCVYYDKHEGDCFLENPKAVAATRDKRAPLDLIEPAGNVMEAWALADGARKYGRKNYDTIAISYRGYLAAMKRHIDALLDGEDFAQDSGVHHLGHVRAGAGILARALVNGNLVDDRGPEERTPEQEAHSASSNQLETAPPPDPTANCCDGSERCLTAPERAAAAEREELLKPTSLAAPTEYDWDRHQGLSDPLG
jgi:hypothetical protein